MQTRVEMAAMIMAEQMLVLTLIASPFTKGSKAIGGAMAQFFTLLWKSFNMPGWLKALIAGYGASKLGGGCLGTIIVFVLIYWLLGGC